MENNNPHEIAIVGMACIYPDANSPQQLWENVLAKRRAFRRIPQVRLSLDDYFSPNSQERDRIYAREAAVIEGYQFDRVKFRIVGSTYRAADLVHWLALDLADRAFEDAGFPEGKGLPRETTGVLLGNTLTGEMSRANTLRLRWPYVRRVLQSRLPVELLHELESLYKEPFPEIGAESLAGNLANTIAGRICNYFDLQGGGYIVDGACSSSLLAVANACSALITGDLDVALAGGVDISLDPFELVGFAKAGALAAGDMYVYDERSAGFIPGEGGGALVLMRYEDAIAQNCRIYSLIRGWGISSDGNGGITRPEVEGHLLAIARAYRRAGIDSNTVAYLEGHGTGTKVGDATELEVLSRARQGATFKAALGSIKANIGHTKAAAGIAGTIKAAMALYHQILPPATGCDRPLVTSDLEILSQGKLWPQDLPLRAGVSAMGFGGINAHIVLESPCQERRSKLTVQERQLLSTSQDEEIFFFGANNLVALQEQVDRLLKIVPDLSRAELTDLAAELSQTKENKFRAAIIANHPQQLSERLQTLQSWLSEPTEFRSDNTSIFFGSSSNKPRLGFLFPGQAAPVYLNGGIWQARFDELNQLYTSAQLPLEGDRQSTVIAQRAIVASALAGLEVLSRLNIVADLAVGNSLGELVALHWAGASYRDLLLEIIRVRARAMEELGDPQGGMASIGTNETNVRKCLTNNSVVIAGFNSPQQTTISGKNEDLERAIAAAKSLGFKAVKLPVSRAFHSPLIASAVRPLEAYLNQQQLQPLQKTVISTVTGTQLSPKENLTSLLCRQIVLPVRFLEAVTLAARDVELFIEVGSGKILQGLVRDAIAIPTISLDAGGNSLQGLLIAAGTSFALGVPIDKNYLFAERFTRPFTLNWQPQFFINPCELAPQSLFDIESEIAIPEPINPVTENLTPIETLRQLVAHKAELPISAIADNSRFLSDLHLNSLSVSQLVVEAARILKLTPPVAPTDYADATIVEVARALTEISTLPDIPSIPSGIDVWIRSFAISLKISPLITSPNNTTFTLQGCQLVKSSQNRTAILVCLPSQPDESQIDLLLEAARQMLITPEVEVFVLLQHAGGGSGFARTFYLENPQFDTCVINIPLEGPEISQIIDREIDAAKGYLEVHYDNFGNRHIPYLQLLEEEPNTDLQLSDRDLLLVTGGGKGIAAECALSLARETGIRLLLLGRSFPQTDPELAKNLDRFQQLGIKFKYIPIDIADLVALQTIEAELKQVTAILHGAGVNTPKKIINLTKQDFLATLAPKVKGLQNILATLDRNSLRLLVTFGSIIARTGMSGEADYALANEWLDLALAKFSQENPHCRCLNLEWSIWSGTGMGERLGRVDALLQQGITPISTDRGIEIFKKALAQNIKTTSLIIASRFGDVPTLKLNKPEFPFLRFLEQPIVYYPGIELIVDCQISTETDPYLQEHIFQGEAVFPAVMGLEAMAQVAMTLLETTQTLKWENVIFLRRVIIPPQQSLTLRILALVKEPGKVEIAIRSESTGLAIDHFRATCLAGNVEVPAFKLAISNLPTLPREDIYQELLFHQGRFQRLRGYKSLRAKNCLAEIATNVSTSWFGRYLPQELILGDPGARDAVIHALQACVPQATILPTGIESLNIYPQRRAAIDTCLVSARERKHINDTFIYDLEVMDLQGNILETWQGLQLQIVSSSSQRILSVNWLAIYLERQWQESLSSLDLKIAIDRDKTVVGRIRSDRLISKTLGTPVMHRLDGKPQVEAQIHLSVSHREDLTLLVTDNYPLGCDLEFVMDKPIEMWKDLLGKERFAFAQNLSKLVNEEFNICATRIWTASECLTKLGENINAPLVFLNTKGENNVCLQSGTKIISTLALQIREYQDLLILALACSAAKEQIAFHSQPLTIKDR
jgi:enediyne polyketide synthase